jgi:hypothetical protein
LRKAKAGGGPMKGFFIGNGDQCLKFAGIHDGHLLSQKMVQDRANRLLMQEKHQCR